MAHIGLDGMSGCFGWIGRRRVARFYHKIIVMVVTSSDLGHFQMENGIRIM